jgi:hypothetical protein
MIRRNQISASAHLHVSEEFWLEHVSAPTVKALLQGPVLVVIKHQEPETSEIKLPPNLCFVFSKIANVTESMQHQT